MNDLGWTRLTSTEFWLTEARLLGALAASAALQLVAILLLYVILRKGLGRAIDRLLPPLLGSATRRRESRIRTISSLLGSIGQYLLLFIAGVMTLHVLGLEVGPIVASAGVVGLAIGFGAQRLFRDVITGFLILLEDQYDVGDTVTISGSTGVVEEMGMRITRLRDEVGKLVILANGDISTVINHSRGPLMVTVDVGVAPDTRLQRVREIVEQLQLPEETWAEPPTVRGVVSMDATKLTVRVVGRAEPGKQSAAELRLRQDLRDALTAAGIKLA